MIGRNHTATQFTGEVGIVLVALVDALLLLAQQVGADGRRRAEALEVERLVVVSAGLLDFLVPEAVGIVAIEGQHLAEGYRLRQLGPSSTGIERQIKTNAQGYSLQGHEIVARAPVLIVKLAGDDGAAVLPLQANDLGIDLTI